MVSNPNWETICRERAKDLDVLEKKGNDPVLITLFLEPSVDSNKLEYIRSCGISVLHPMPTLKMVTVEGPALSILHLTRTAWWIQDIELPFELRPA